VRRQLLFRHKVGDLNPSNKGETRSILALFPLALEGGPLWQPLCYAQIGGLAVAAFTTLLLVPVLFSIFVLDLKIIRWETKQPPAETEARPAPEMLAHTS
jgi:hypothetical protein